MKWQSVAWDQTCLGYQLHQWDPVSAAASVEHKTACRRREHIECMFPVSLSWTPLSTFHSLCKITTWFELTLSLLGIYCTCIFNISGSRGGPSGGPRGSPKKLEQIHTRQNEIFEKWSSCSIEWHFFAISPSRNLFMDPPLSGKIVWRTPAASSQVVPVSFLLSESNVGFNIKHPIS